MSLFLDKLLDFYSFNKKDLDNFNIKPDKKNIIIPNLNDKYLKLVIDKIKDIIKNNTKTLIYGDYDVDGISSTAILYLTFQKLKFNPGFFIPSRYNDGYGINKERIDFFNSLGYKVIITVDNGISAIDEIDYANSLGIEIIIIDHHEIGKKIPSTDYIFHHHLSKFVDYEVSAAFLTLIVSYYLLENNFDDYLLFLSGLAALSDVMPIKGNNLIIIKYALDLLKQNEYPNIKALISDYSYDSLSFELIPTLNAPGRVDADIRATINACKYLIYHDDISEISNLKEYLIKINNKKKELIKEVNYDNVDNFISTNSRSYVINSLSGIGGLVCSKLLNQYKVPILVVAPDFKNNDYYVGSIRVPPCYSLTSFMNKNKDKFINSGGHEFASGFTLEKKKYMQLAVDFASEMEKQALNKKEDKCIEIDFDDITLDNYYIYERFMPFGPEHVKPLFQIKISSNLINIKSDSYAFAINKFNNRIVIFNNINELKEIKNKDIILQGNLSKNIFNGKINIQFIVTNISFYTDVE